MKEVAKKTRFSMGESKKSAIFNFDHSLKLEFCGVKITSNAGLLVYREFDEAFNLTKKLADKLTEFRTGDNTQHKLLQLIRQSIYSRLAGCEDVNDADLLKQDPALRLIVGGRAKEKLAASTSEMNRFETTYLTREENIEVLRNINGEWIDCIDSCKNRQKLNHVILDIDSSESQTYGNQERSTFNGYFGCTCYHPLFCFNRHGDLEGALLRGGSVHSANNWKVVLEPIVSRYKKVANNAKKPFKIYIRGDAAFGSPEFYEYAESKGTLYTVRLKANAKLQVSIEHLLKRPTGRP